MCSALKLDCVLGEGEGALVSCLSPCIWKILGCVPKSLSTAGLQQTGVIILPENWIECHVYGHNLMSNAD